jgi:lipid A biosynthesis lauroyl/palmitoleoyl acyltransferase
MKKHNFYHPKFIPTWLLIGLMKTGAQLPLKLQIILGKFMGHIFYRTLKKFKHIARINLTHCFPQKTTQEVTQLLKAHFESIGIGIFEMSNCFYMSDKRLKKIYQLHHGNILQNALNNQHNILILVGHFTTMMLAGRILLQNFNFADVYRPQNNPLFNHEMQKIFTQHGSTMIKVGALRALIKTLKSGLPIWYAHDQDLGKKNSLFASFFNIPTATIQATSKLAKTTNAVVIPLSFIRKDTHYVLKFSPILAQYPSPDEHDNANRTNQILEQQILQAPEQYLWIHRRFKTRPKGEKSFY